MHTHALICFFVLCSVCVYAVTWEAGERLQDAAFHSISVWCVGTHLLLLRTCGYEDK